VKLGVLGGTFDPVHLGHLSAAAAAMDCAQLDHILFIPSFQPPHRPPAHASAGQRLEMCRLAVEGEPRFEASDLEVRRGGPSYTVDTLQELTRNRPTDQLHLILGWDAAKLFRTWHEPDKVMELAWIVVVSRPGTSAPDSLELKSAGLDPSRVIPCLRSTPDISGSELRRTIAAGAPITGEVPGPVERYIAAHDLYRDNR
jgi:nicotinate-nucleotide adenylyltransferase